MDPLTQDSGSPHPVLYMVSPPSKQFHYDPTYPEIWVFLTTHPLFIYKKQARIPLCTPNWPRNTDPFVGLSSAGVTDGISVPGFLFMSPL